MVYFVFMNIHISKHKKILRIEGIKSICFSQIWLFSYLLAIAKYLASNQNNASRASVLRGFHLNKQGNFHFKCMFCHAFTQQYSLISHLMQMPGYWGSYTPPEKHKTISACPLLSPARFHIQPEVWLQSLNVKPTQILVSMLKSDLAQEFYEVAASQLLLSFISSLSQGYLWPEVGQRLWYAQIKDVEYCSYRIKLCTSQHCQ